MKTIVETRCMAVDVTLLTSHRGRPPVSTPAHTPTRVAEPLERAGDSSGGWDSVQCLDTQHHHTRRRAFAKRASHRDEPVVPDLPAACFPDVSTHPFAFPSRSRGIERRQDTADRRVRTIHPTPKAREVYAKVKAMAVEVYEESLKGVPPETRRGLISGLNAMVENLSDGEQSSCDAVKTSEGMETA